MKAETEAEQLQQWIDSLPDDAPAMWLITVRPHTWVYWSNRDALTRWAPDEVRSMPIERYMRYGYQGGRLGKRARRERSAAVAALSEERT